jgi:hypothetical protein
MIQCGIGLNKYARMPPPAPDFNHGYHEPTEYLRHRFTSAKVRNIGSRK